MTHTNYSQGILWLVVVSKSLCIATEAKAGEGLLNEHHLLQAIVESDTPFHLRAAYTQLLSGASEEEVRALKNHKHHAIAVQASWEELRRETVAAHGRESTRLERCRADAFLNVVKNRVPTRVPAWWKKTVYNAKWTGTSFAFSVASYRPYELTRSGFYAPTGVAVDEVGGKLSIVVGETSFSVTKPDAGVRCVEPSLCVAIGPNARYVAIHSGLRSPYSVVTVLPDWQESSLFAEVWTGPIVFHSGIVVPDQRVGCHAISMEPAQEQLVVFGADQYSIYFEVFRNDGTNVARFSSSYCCH